MKKFFDEESSKWLSMYKGLTIFFFFGSILFGIIFGIIDAKEYIVFDSEVLSIVIWVLIGAVAAFVQLVCNMLIIQLLKNVRAIKEKITDTEPKKAVKSDELPEI